MSNSENLPTWICPLCINNRIPYGTSCKDTENCGGIFNANAFQYINLETRESLKKKSEKSTGISEIANKEE